MIENFLIESGFGCGTVKNFQSEILKNIEFAKGHRWYFKTPVKISDSGLRSANLDLAFPFVAIPSDIDEAAVIERLELNRKSYEDELLQYLRAARFIVPPSTAIFTVIPFWADSANYRKELQDFGGTRIHIINAVLTVKYRESWFC